MECTKLLVLTNLPDRAAAEKLAALGYTNVRPFEGGLSAWKEAGRRVEKAG